jgi:aspartate dehydrogenase
MVVPVERVIVLIIGCGSIGTVIAKAADRMDDVENILLYDIDGTKAEQLSASLRNSEVLGLVDFKEIEAELAIEAAGQKAAKDLVPSALENGMDTMVMSVGAFGDKDFQDRCFSAVSKYDSIVMIPSGAVAGVDALKAAGRAKLDIVKLTTTKPPKGLAGVRYLLEKGVKVEDIRERTIIYSGPASQAVQYFPANVNVAATVSLAGIGFERTQVEIVCDPLATVNSHHLFAKGDFGEMEATTRNLPSPDNPRTSYLASLSAVSTLKEYLDRVWIGA